MFEVKHTDFVQADSVMTLQYSKVPTRNESNDHVFLIDSVGDTTRQAEESTKGKHVLVLFFSSLDHKNRTTTTALTLNPTNSYPAKRAVLPDSTDPHFFFSHFTNCEQKCHNS